MTTETPESPSETPADSASDGAADAPVPAARKPQPHPRDDEASDSEAHDSAESSESSRPTEVEDRGRLEVSHAVVRKVAERLVDGVSGVTTQRRTLGGDRGATVKVGGTGVVIDLALDVALEYPIDVRATVRRMRESLTDEVSRITGYEVRGIDVVVSSLRAEGPSTSRVN